MGPYKRHCVIWDKKIRDAFIDHRIPDISLIGYFEKFTPLLAPAILSLAPVELLIHQRQNLRGRDFKDGSHIRGILEPVVRRNIHGHFLLLRGYVLGDADVQDHFVVAGPHFDHFPVDIFECVIFPNFDDLFRIRALRPFDDAHEPVGCHDPAGRIGCRMGESDTAVRRRLPFFCLVGPCFVEFNLVGRFEERRRIKIGADIGQTLCAFHAGLVQVVGFIDVGVGEGELDAHLPGLLQQVSRVGKPVARENNLGAGSLYLRQVGGIIRQEQLMVILTNQLGVGIVLLEAFFEAVREAVSEGIVLVEDVEFLFLLPDLAVIISQSARR
jgi:hypothetical protein